MTLLSAPRYLLIKGCMAKNTLISKRSSQGTAWKWLPISRKEFQKEGAFLRDELDKLFRSIATLGEHCEELRKELIELRSTTKLLSKKVLD